MSNIFISTHQDDRTIKEDLFTTYAIDREQERTNTTLRKKIMKMKQQPGLFQ